MAVWTVAKEMGHESTDMIERVYGHLGTVRHRAKAVEYRVAQDPCGSRAGSSWSREANTTEREPKLVY